MARKYHQAFADGLAAIYGVTNSAEAGAKPVETLTLKYRLRYDERSLSSLRYYPAGEAQEQITYLLRMPYRRDVGPHDIAVPNDGKKYRVTQVYTPQEVPGCMDITLAMLEPEEYSD